MMKEKGYKIFIEIVKKLKNNKDIYFLSLGKKIITLIIILNYKHIDFLPNKETSEFILIIRYIYMQFYN